MARIGLSGFALCAALIFTCTCVQSAVGQENATEDEEAQAELALRNVISSWASAWQSQLDDIYLLHYHPNFTPEGEISRENWEETRRVRILEPETIRISLREFSVLAIGPSSATVHFTLNYSRPGYADTTRKEMELGLNGQIWQILRETNLGVQRLPAPIE